MNVDNFLALLFYQDHNIRKNERMICKINVYRPNCTKSLVSLYSLNSDHKYKFSFTLFRHTLQSGCQFMNVIQRHRMPNAHICIILQHRAVRLLYCTVYLISGCYSIVLSQAIDMSASLLEQITFRLFCLLFIYFYLSMFTP